MTGPPVREVLRRLREEQGPLAPRPRLPVLDELIATVLSQHTSDRNSERAFFLLRSRFPSWEEVRHAPTGEIADAIRCGGIADQKAVRIQRILAEIERREGVLDLERLRRLDDAEVERYLTSLPGVGPKTAACVLLFAMGRPAFPVDTHVHRVTTRLGWLRVGATAEEAHRVLSALVPPDIRHDLHLALVTHGRRVCRARVPHCPTCPIRRWCTRGPA
ncbi:MAG TPA: endonuclease III [Candidatus Dormibacteraeota bacterium]|nr:endonuclease III [Candidatus Dormibacteraeota bacterium]